MIPWSSVAGTQSWKTGIVEAPVGSPVKNGNGAIVSHGAIIHGASIGDNALVGIGAIVLEGVDVGPASIIGAGAIVPPRAGILPNTLALGIPAMPVARLGPGKGDGCLGEAVGHLEGRKVQGNIRRVILISRCYGGR